MSIGLPGFSYVETRVARTTWLSGRRSRKRSSEARTPPWPPSICASFEPPSAAPGDPSRRPLPTLPVSCSGGPLRRSRRDHRRPPPPGDSERDPPLTVCEMFLPEHRRSFRDSSWGNVASMGTGNRQFSWRAGFHPPVTHLRPTGNAPGGISQANAARP